MNSVVEYRSREAVIDPYVEGRYCGGRVDDILRRLGNVETDVSALKVQMGSILTLLPHLATKTDIAEFRTELMTDIGGVRTEIASLETRAIKWMIATVLASTAVAFSIARFVH